MLFHQRRFESQKVEDTKSRRDEETKREDVKCKVIKRTTISKYEQDFRICPADCHLRSCRLAGAGVPCGRLLPGSAGPYGTGGGKG